MDAKDLALSFRCDERWEAMPGDDRARRCARCDHSVHDLSARTELGARVLLATARKPCVRYAVEADGSVRFRPSRLAKVAAALLAFLPAVARAEPDEASAREEVHLCSPPGQSVVLIGRPGPGFALLPDFGAMLRALRPQGDAVAHLIFDPARWSRVAVKCQGSWLARHARTDTGEVTVYDLPDGTTCTATLKGDARPTQVRFVAGQTVTRLESGSGGG
jgi:hypothetical protein